jgi:hypothetical protein
MKKIGEYTARGKSKSTPSVQKINLFDGRFDTGFRIKEFRIAPVDTDDTTLHIFTAKLATVGDLGTVNWNWDNQNELAWSSITWDGNSANGMTSFFSHWDEDALIIEDLYVYVNEAAGNDVAVNYEIILEKYEFSDWKGALAMARDKQSE